MKYSIWAEATHSLLIALIKPTLSKNTFYIITIITFIFLSSLCGDYL